MNSMVFFFIVVKFYKLPYAAQIGNKIKSVRPLRYTLEMTVLGNLATEYAESSPTLCAERFTYTLVALKSS